MHPSASRLDQFAANPRRALWMLALPIMLGMSIQTIYMIVDMVFVGRISGDALIALAFNMPLVFLAMGTTFGLGSAVTALIAQSIGARDKRRADLVAEHSVVLALLLIVVFTGTGLLFGRELLQIIGVPDDLLPLAWSYFRIIALGFAFMVTSVFLRSVLSGEGEVKIPVAIQGVGTLLNIGLDPLFIFTFGMGVQGAALATILSQALVAACFIYLMFVRKRTYVDFDLSSFRWSGTIVRDLLRIGVPASLSFLIMSLGGGLFNRILVDYSASAVAATQVGSRLDHIVILPLVAISSALVTLVGMFYGARRTELLRGVVRYAITRAIVIASTAGALFYFAAPWLVAIFTQDPEIRDLGVRYMRIVVFAYPLIGVSMLTGRCLQGLGKGTPELILTLLRVVLIAAPLSIFFHYWLGKPVEWVWWSMVGASVVTATIAGLWLRVALGASLRSIQSELSSEAGSEVNGETEPMPAAS